MIGQIARRAEDSESSERQRMLHRQTILNAFLPSALVRLRVSVQAMDFAISVIPKILAMSRIEQDAFQRMRRVDGLISAANPARINAHLSPNLPFAL